MYELPIAIPDPQILLSLQPEELGAKMLFLLRKRSDKPNQSLAIHLSNLLNELWPQSYIPGQSTPYPGQLRSQIDLAVSEAWSWLVAQGLLVSPGSSGSSDGRVLSRRARSFEDARDFADFAVARKLPKELLHPALADKVWSAFMRSDFDVAALQAFKAVEVAVRDASELPAGLLGTPLMRKAFDPKTGPLTDMAAEEGEKEARSALFAGAIGSFKNPHSHRNVPLDDPAEAAEIIMLANLLLRIVDGRIAAKTP